MNSTTAGSSVPVAAAPAGPDAETKAYVNDERFSRTFTVPLESTPGRTDPLVVGYSDFGHHHPEGPSHDNVIVICGPMLSSRLLHVAKDKLAKRYGLRIIHPDRPGMGKTTAVPIDQRLEAWNKILAALLAHLQITRISLVCQSGGALYAASTLFHLRHLLHPVHPYMAMGAPWMDPTHTGATAMVITSAAVPSAILGRLERVSQLMQSVTRVFDFSSGILKALVPRMGGMPPLADGVDAAEAEFEEKVLPLLIERAFTEEMSGLGQEALLFMRREGRWGDWGDYDRLVEMIAAQEKGERSAKKLRMRVFWAESDIMIGTDKGPAWFDKCWGNMGADRIEYRSSRVPHADHDSVLDLRFGIMERIFKEVAELAAADDSTSSREEDGAGV